MKRIKLAGHHFIHVGYAWLIMPVVILVVTNSPAKIILDRIFNCYFPETLISVYWPLFYAIGPLFPGLAMLALGYVLKNNYARYNSTISKSIFYLSIISTTLLNIIAPIAVISSNYFNNSKLAALYACYDTDNRLFDSLNSYSEMAFFFLTTTGILYLLSLLWILFKLRISSETAPAQE